MTVKSNSITITVKAPIVLTTIDLSSNTASIDTGGSVDFTATAYDQNGNPMSGVSLILEDSTTGSSVNMGTTGSNGQVSASVVFNSAGTFVVYAED